MADLADIESKRISSLAKNQNNSSVRPNPELVTVTNLSKKFVSVKFQEQSIQLPRDYYVKLQSIYQSTLSELPSDHPLIQILSSLSSQSSIKESKENVASHESQHSTEPLHLFNYYLWCLLTRYRTILGTNRRFEGSGLQASIPPEGFRYMVDNFDVSMECFASPFNCFFTRYCSAFNDIDLLFGSCGSFLNFYPLQGSFQANPPFCEELMMAMVSHIFDLLSRSSRSLINPSFLGYIHFLK
jgi:hypothetical protein